MGTRIETTRELYNLKLKNKELSLGYNKNLYEEIDNKYFPNDTRCRVCNSSIYYTKSYFKVSKENIIYKPKEKTSSNSSKTINGITYNLSVCESCMTNYFNDYVIGKRVFNLVNKYSKYAFNIPDEVSSNFLKEKAVTLDNCIKRHGIEKGTLVYNDYKNRQSYTNTLEYKKTLGWSEDDFKNYNDSRAVTLDNCIRRHGIDKGTKIYNDYCNKQSYAGVKLDYFIEKYGDVKGNEIYKELLKRKLLVLDTFIRKYGNVEGTIKYKEYLNNKSKPYSKISQIIFNKIDKLLDNKYETFYAEKNEEIYIYSNEYKKGFLLDYYIKDLNLCIEYNGDYWHCNPKIYKIDEKINQHGILKNVEDIWNRDKERYNILKNEFNIDTIVIWESDIIDYNKLIQQINTFKK